MKLYEKFTDVHAYAASMEAWCLSVVSEFTDIELIHTFATDLAIADWYGVNDVMDTYERIKQQWIADYKTFAEAVITINLMALAHSQLSKQGVDDRGIFSKLYIALYVKAKKDYFDYYKGNMEASDYLFTMI